MAKRTSIAGRRKAKAPSVTRKKKASTPAEARKAGPKAKAVKPVSKTKKTKTVKKAARKTAARTRKSTAAKAGKSSRSRRASLTGKDLREFHEMLLEKRREILGDMTGMEEQTARKQEGGGLSNMPTHMADVGSDTFEHEFTLGLLESERQLLHEISQALVRISEGTYGICQGTGDPIPRARLQARPWARYTVEFRRMLEKGLVSPPADNAKEDINEGDEEE